MLNKKVIVGIIAAILLFLGIYTFALNDEEPIDNPKQEEKDEDKTPTGDDNNDTEVPQQEEDLNNGPVNNFVPVLQEVDNTNPEITEVLLSTEDPSKEGVIITVVATDNAPLQYSFNNGPWQDGNTFTATENGDVEIRVRDTNNNITTRVIKIGNIDTTNPTVIVSYNITSKTKEDVIVTLTFSEEVTGLDASWIQDLNNPLVYNKVFETNNTEILTFNDLAGNAGTEEVKVENIDKTAPNAPVINTDNVYVGIKNTHKVVTWTHDGNDLGSFEYREYNSLGAAKNDEAYWIVGKDSTTFTQNVGVNWNSSITLYYRIVAIDEVGNRSELSEIGTIIIDKTAPTVEIKDTDKFNPLTFDVLAEDLNGIKRIDYSVYTNNNTVRVYISGENISNLSKLEKTYTLRDLSDGEYTLRVTVSDAAGNSKNATNFNFIVDNSGPVVNFEPDGNLTEKPTHNTKVLITDAVGFTAKYLWTNSNTQPSEIEFNNNGIEVVNDQRVTTPFFDTGVYYLWVMAQDELGNTTYKMSNEFRIYSPIRIDMLKEIRTKYNGYSLEFSLLDGLKIENATNIVLELYKDTNLVSRNTLTNDPTKRDSINNSVKLSSPFAPYGDFNYVVDGYWTNNWFGSRETIPNRGLVKVTIGGVTYTKEINVNLTSVKPEVIDWILLENNTIGYDGYSLNFNMKKFNMGKTSNVVVELLKDTTLVSRNTLTTDSTKKDLISGLTEITSPFAPYGDFNYVVDGYWTNNWFGSKDTIPNKARVTLTINGVKYTKEVDVTVVSAKPEVIDWIIVKNNYEGFNGYGFNFKLKKFKIGDTSSVVTELLDINGNLMARNTLRSKKIVAYASSTELTSPFAPFGDRDYSTGSWDHNWYGSREAVPAKARVKVVVNGVTYTKEVDVTVVSAKPEVIDWIVVKNNYEGFNGYGFNFKLKKFKIGDTSSVVTELLDTNGNLMARNTLRSEIIVAYASSTELTSPFAPFGDRDYSTGSWDHNWYGSREAVPAKARVKVVVNGVTYTKEVDISVTSVKPDVISWINVLKNTIGYTGYGFNFGMKKFNIGNASNITLELYVDDSLLSRNILTNVPEKRSEISGFTEITSPFDPNGDFDYEGDGFWINTWYGSRDREPNKAVVKIVINGVTYIKERNIDINNPDL